MIITRGCECTPFKHKCSVHGDHNNVPTAYIIIRGTEELKICTRCLCTGDEIIAFMFDAHSDAMVFGDYDALGTFIMLGYMSESEEFDKET